MKKFSIFLMMLMGVFLPWAATGQQTLTVFGDGTTTTNTYVPIYGLYCDEGVKCEFVIPAEKLVDMENSTISSMKFYLASSGTHAEISPSFTIFLKEVDFTTMTEYKGATNATTVFNNTIAFTTNASNVEVEIPFSENYNYSGGNLLIGVYQNGTSDYNSTTWTGVSQSYNSAWRGYGSSSGSGAAFLPKTTFTFTAAPGYRITCNTAANGSISASPKKAEAGDQVTITATPDANYQLGSLTVRDANNDIVTVNMNGNTGTFTMPASDVTATATFIPSGSGGTTTTTTWEETTSITTGTDYLIGFSSGGNVYLAVNYAVNETSNHYYTNSSSTYYGFTAQAAFDGNGNVTGVSGYATDLQYCTWQFSSASSGYYIQSAYQTNYYLKTYSSTNYADLYPGSGNSSNADWTYSSSSGGQLYRTISSTKRYANYYSLSNNPHMYVANSQSTPVKLYKKVTNTITTYGIIATSNNAEGGTVTGSDYYTSGSTCTLTATAYDGYDFVNWTENGTEVSTNPTYSFTVSGARTLVANFRELSSCHKPTNFIASTPTAHATTLSWTKGGEENAWVLQYGTDANFTSGTYTEVTNGFTMSGTTVSYPLNNLTGETTYYARVKADCGNNEESGWNNTSFTTEVACPVPTITNINPGGRTAQITCSGDAESFNVMYREKPAAGGSTTYDFEDGTQGWTVLKGNTGDSPNNWHHNTTHVSYSGDTQHDWSSFGNNSSSGFMISESYISATSSGGTTYGAVTPDNYLVSPQVRLGGSISFYAGARNTDYCAEKFSVMISTTDNTNTANFTTVQTWTLTLSATGYNSTPYTADLSAFAGQTGYIAIRHYDCRDQWVLCVDDITIVEGAMSTEWSQSIPVSGNPFTINGLSPETEYEVIVQANCSASNDGLSGWSEAETFTTTITCPATSNLSYSEVENHSTKLSWTNGATESAWQICLNGDESNLIAATTNPFTLTGLQAETTYSVKVRANCGGSDGESQWSNTVTFTTDEACPAPAITSVNPELTSAFITTSSDATTFNVRYRVSTAFYYDFESTEPWTLTNFSPCEVYDGDGGSTYAISGAFYPHQNYTGSFMAFQNGLPNSPQAHNGNAFGACFASTTSTVHPNNDYFILPELAIQNGYVLSFYAKSFSSSYPETFKVGIYNGNGALSTTLGTETDISDEWEEYSYNLSAYAGQTIRLAINCVSDDAFALQIDDIFVGNPNGTGSWTTLNNVTDLSLSSLTRETQYEVQLQSVCGEDGSSDWSSSAIFTTLSGCDIPYNLAANNVTNNAATLTWHGAQSTYNVRYALGTPAVTAETTEDFTSCTATTYSASASSSNYPSGWYMYVNSDSYAYTPRVCNANTVSAMSGDNYLILSSKGAGSGTTVGDAFAIMPRYQNIASVTLEYAYSSEIGSLAIGYVTSNTTTPSTSTITILDALSTSTTRKTYTMKQADIDAINNNNGYIIFMYCATSSSTNYYHAGIDNIVVTTTTTPATYGTWNTSNTNKTSPLELDGLTANSIYVWQVQGVDCNASGSETDWSADAYFTTLPQFTKEITGVGADGWNDENNGGYYLIASPLADAVEPTHVTNMIPSSGNYDLYAFDEDPQDGMEWLNYKVSPKPFTTLDNGKGYLYASKETVTLTFVGMPYSGDGKVNLYKTEDAEFEGWNLVGNPFAVDAYITKACYTLENSDTYTVNSAGTAIHAMQGLLVEANSDGEELQFSTSSSKKAATLNMNVSMNRSVIDQAIISFSEGQQLPKLQFRQNSTKVYMPKEGIDYAIVSAESNVGEMPVNFKAENNGTYTLSFNAEEVSFAYLHLIDNMTGNDVDLLANPSYSFNAKTTDYESRFKLVFATGNNANDDTFAFYSNGNFIINNEGEATLQLIDINGRILKSESINGCANVNVNAAQGIYMLRLVNGENVKVQKMVVR